MKCGGSHSTKGDGRQYRGVNNAGSRTTKRIRCSRSFRSLMHRMGDYFSFRNPGPHLLLLLLTSLCVKAEAVTDDLGNQVQSVNIDCDPAEIRLVIRTSKPFSGRVYPKGLGKSACERIYNESSTSGTAVTTYSLPLTGCNTAFQEIPTGLEYQNVITIQVHRHLVTQADKIYSVRCKYESMNTTIVATMNMSDTLPAMQLESSALLPQVGMSIYKGTSESRVMAEAVTIGDPVALVINLASQNTYGMLITNCLVRDGGDMGGLQPLINSKGCPVDPTLFGAFTYSSDLTQAYVIFRAHKFPYTDSLYYECNLKFCLKAAGECQRLPVPPQCGKGGAISRVKRNDHKDSTSGASGPNTERPKTVAVVRSIIVREPGMAEAVVTANPEMAYDIAQPVPIRGQWCVPKGVFAVVLGIAAFLIIISTTILVIIILDKRKRRYSEKTGSSDVYSSIYMSYYGGDRTRLR